ncbi:MAG TPA: hypothetical protein VFJ61_04310 [Solirubrobacterales bacterium]|nr:hypothetical protein [Solirubrobacterales bacterium]
MSILDDAIREHLELKRAHGADEAELKKLEDEAFGPPGRPEEPDPFAEAPTEFLTTPEVEAGEPEDEAGRRRINIADLQEPPPPEKAGQEQPQVEPAAAIEPQAEAVPLIPAEDTAQAAPPAEEPVAEEDEAAERQAIAEQPTEFFDIEAEMGTADAPPAEAPSPSDEEIAAAELSEPTLAPAEPPTEIHATRTSAPAEEELVDEDEEDDEFWSEQRLSDELDQALEAPLTEEHELPPPTDAQEPAAPAAEPPAPVDEDDSEEALRPDYDPDTGHEDVLEDTPEFLEDAPEDDELWFEQRPPKDFNFDD